MTEWMIINADNGEILVEGPIMKPELQDVYEHQGWDNWPNNTHVIPYGSHIHCPYCCGPEQDYHTSCFYIDANDCPERVPENCAFPDVSRFCGLYHGVCDLEDCTMQEVMAASEPQVQFLALRVGYVPDRNLND